MSKRERALELANKAMPIEAGEPMPDTQVVMAYALVLALVDIGEQLKRIDDNLDLIIAHGIGVQKEAA